MRTKAILSGLMAFAIGSAGAATIATPASAAEQPVVRKAYFNAAELRAASVRADRLPATATKARSRVAEHLNDQARLGRVVDERTVSVASLPDPFTPGRRIDVVWEGEQAPQSIEIQLAEFADGSGQMGMGVESGGAPATAIVPTSTGAGYSAGSNPKNMYKQNNGCTTTWFDPHYTADRDHKMVSCWEWWAQPSTVHWVYNRWMLWTPAVPKFGLYKTTDLYAASRPWAGYESRLPKLNDWSPRYLNATCYTAGTFTLSGTYGGVTGEVSVPYNKCEDYWLDINTTSRKIGIDYQLDDTTWNGRTGQMYMDVAGDFNASNSTVVPIMADYNWATVANQFVQGTWQKQHWVQKDSGW
ncbi:MAG TPA: hypothetical protein VF174_00110 [Micromonosporaceae bacterium]